MEPLPKKKEWSFLLILVLFCRPCLSTVMVSLEDMWKSRKIERKTERLADNSIVVVAEKNNTIKLEKKQRGQNLSGHMCPRAPKKRVKCGIESFNL
jgi:hypothetical protein